MQSPDTLDAGQHTGLQGAARDLAYEQRIPGRALAQQHDDRAVDGAGQHLAHQRGDVVVGERCEFLLHGAVPQQDVEQRFRQRLTVAGSGDHVDRPTAVQGRDDTGGRAIQRRHVVDDQHRSVVAIHQDVAQGSDERDRIGGGARTGREQMRHRTEGHLDGRRGALDAMHGVTATDQAGGDLLEAARSATTEWGTHQRHRRRRRASGTDGADRGGHHAVATHARPGLCRLTERRVWRTGLADAASMAPLRRPEHVGHQRRRVARQRATPPANSTAASAAPNRLEDRRGECTGPASPRFPKLA